MGTANGEGYAARTINLRVNVVNSFLEYLGLPVQTMDNLTVVAARRGRFSADHKLGSQQVQVSQSLQGELLDYSRRAGCTSLEPVFSIRTGKPAHRIMSMLN